MLLRLFRSRRGETARRQPPTFVRVQIVVDEAEEPEVFETKETPLHSLVGTILAIEYVDAKGSFSRRRITVREVRQNKGALALACYCHERRAPRLFRLDRIRSAIDVQTGEVFDDVGDWLAACGHAVDGRASPDPLAVIGPGMQVLAYLAHCDGRYDEREHAVIRQYVEETGAGHGLNAAQIERLIRSLYPDEQTFDEALDALEEAGRPALDMIARHAMALARADGVVGEEELFWIEQIKMAQGHR